MRKIEEVDAVGIRRDLGLEQGELTVLAGGPRCQGFSINAPERFLEDSRNALFQHYMKFLDEFQPQAFLFENVPGMLSPGGGQVVDEIMRQFKAHGYQPSAKILFAAHYASPPLMRPCCSHL